MKTKTNFTSPSPWRVSALALLATTVTLLTFTPLSEAARI
jgi:hypothetical protein